MTQVASRPKKVLLIDRDARLGHVRCLVLQSQGYEATCVTDASTVLNSWISKTYDLVLVDVEGVSGIADAEHLCSEIKTAQPGQRVAFVCNWRVAIATDCPDDILRTEFDPTAFVEGVKDIFGSKS